MTSSPPLTSQSEWRMTTPISHTSGDPNRPSPAQPPVGLPGAAPQQNGVGRPPTQQQSQRPRQNAMFNSANLNLPPGVNGFNSNMSDQARLALAQQALQGFQANGGGSGSNGPGGMTMANAAALLGNGQGGNSEAILRQVSRIVRHQVLDSHSVASAPTISGPHGTTTDDRPAGPTYRFSPYEYQRQRPISCE